MLLTLHIWFNGAPTKNAVCRPQSHICISNNFDHLIVISWYVENQSIHCRNLDHYADIHKNVLPILCKFDLGFWCAQSSNFMSCNSIHLHFSFVTLYDNGRLESVGSCHIYSNNKVNKKNRIMPGNAVQCFNTCKSNQHRMWKQHWLWNLSALNIFDCHQPTNFEPNIAKSRCDFFVWSCFWILT